MSPVPSRAVRRVRRRIRPVRLERPVRLLRSLVSAVLITTACALAPLTTFMLWARYEIGDRDAYVATMAPLASDDAVQDDVADAVTEAIMDHVDHVDQESDGTRDDVVGSGPPRGSVETFVNDAVHSFTGTHAYRAAWIAANRATHDAVLRALSAGHDGTVGVDIAPISDRVRHQLIADSVPLARRIPVEHTDVTVLRAGQLSVPRKGFRMLQVMDMWLPAATAALAAAGILLAVRRGRALTATAAGFALGAGLLLAAVAAARALTLDDLPPDVSRASAGAVYDALTHTLTVTSWAILAAGAGTAAAMWLLGKLTRGRGTAGPTRPPESARPARPSGLSGLPGLSGLSGVSGLSGRCLMRRRARRGTAPAEPQEAPRGSRDRGAHRGQPAPRASSAGPESTGRRDDGTRTVVGDAAARTRTPGPVNDP